MGFPNGEILIQWLRIGLRSADPTTYSGGDQPQE